MTTRRRKVVVPQQVVGPESIPSRDLARYVRSAMIRYGTETNENRAIPSYQDGLKPVQRKLIFSALKICYRAQAKTARLVGDTIGRLHPHGDNSAADAVANMVNAPTPLFTGIGNWGSLVDPPAAMRYTELMLSRSGHQLVQKDYLAITPMCPNYDDREEEPIFLPALLPFILMNPSVGIGLGVTTNIPAFTPSSLLTICCMVLRGEEITPLVMQRTLEFNEAWGGRVVRSKANAKAIQDLMVDSTSSSVAFCSEVEVDEVKKRIIIRGAAPGLNLEGLRRRIRMLKTVQSVTSEEKGVSYTIRAKRGIPTTAFDALVALVRKLTTTSVPYNIYVSKRTPTGDGKYDTSFARYSVLNLIKEWLKFRIVLEYKCLEFRLGKVDELIHRLKLIVLAANHVDAIVAALKKPNTAELISKALKVSIEDAQTILQLRLQQLTKLDKDRYSSRIEELTAVSARLRSMMKAPEKVVLQSLEACQSMWAESTTAVPGSRQWVFTLPESKQRSLQDEMAADQV